jgi:hypothetical protein
LEALKIVTESRKYSPANICIYCGSTQSLNDEHILPFGLAGDCLILQKASCKKCAEATGSVETRCLRHMWLPIRTQLGAPTRSRLRPSAMSLKRIRVDEYDRVNDIIIRYTKLSMNNVPVENYPVFYQAYKFPEAGLFVGRYNSVDTEYATWCKMDISKARSAVGTDREGFSLGPCNPDSFCRMLAKIAHGFCVAEMGSDQIVPFLSGYSRGEQLDRLQYIGCVHNNDAAETYLHTVKLSTVLIDQTPVFVVDIRLFAFMRTPTYRVIVGNVINYSTSAQKNIILYEIEFNGQHLLRDAPIMESRAIGGWQ